MWGWSIGWLKNQEQFKKLIIPKRINIKRYVGQCCARQIQTNSIFQCWQWSRFKAFFFFFFFPNSCIYSSILFCSNSCIYSSILFYFHHKKSGFLLICSVQTASFSLYSTIFKVIFDFWIPR